MPRGQKSKLRARKKHDQARHDSKSQKRVQAAAVAEQATSCRSVFEGAVDTRSDKGDKSQDEKSSCLSQISYPGNPCSDILTMKVDLLEQFLLNKYKVEEPILKEDMLKLVGEDYQDQFADILKKASERIEVVFALDLKEVDSSNHSYDLVSKLKLPNNGKMCAGTGLPKTGLLMNILGLIFMKGNCATEDDVWKFLNMLQIYDGNEHFFYGEPRKLITKDFVQLQYLEYRQVPDSDPPCYEFLWGPKAYTETSKMEVLEFLSKVGDKVPSAFPFWYEEALQDEERARAIDADRAGTSAPASQDSMALASPTHSDV